MSETSVSVTVGGEEIKVPVPYNFKRIKLCWPHMALAANSEDNPIEGLDAMIAVVAIGLAKIVSPMTAEAKAEAINDEIEMLEEKILGPEITGLQKSVMEIMRGNGLIRQKADGTIVGNVIGAEPDAPSMETGTPSSPNSLLQGAAAATGT